MTFLLLSSCSASKFCERKFPSKVDTIVQTDTIWKPRLVKVGYPADSVDIFIPYIEIDRHNAKPIVKIKRSKQASVKITIDSTGISAEAKCAEKDSIIKILEAQITRKEKITSVQHIPVKTIPWYLKYAGYWSLVSIPLTLVWLINKIRKIFMVV